MLTSEYGHKIPAGLTRLSSHDRFGPRSSCFGFAETRQLRQQLWVLAMDKVSRSRVLILFGLVILPGLSSAIAGTGLNRDSAQVRLIQTVRLPKDNSGKELQPCAPAIWVPHADGVLFGANDPLLPSGVRYLFFWKPGTHRVKKILNLAVLEKTFGPHFKHSIHRASAHGVTPGKSSGWKIGGMFVDDGKLATIFQNTIQPPTRPASGPQGTAPNPGIGLPGVVMLRPYCITDFRVMCWHMARRPFRLSDRPTTSYLIHVRSSLGGEGCRVVVPPEGSWFGVVRPGDVDTAGLGKADGSYPTLLFDLASGRKVAQSAAPRFPPSGPFASPRGVELGWLATLTLAGDFPGPKDRRISGDTTLRLLQVPSHKIGGGGLVAAGGHPVHPKVIPILRVHIHAHDPKAILRWGGAFSPNGRRIFVLAQRPFFSSLHQVHTQIIELSSSTGRVMRSAVLSRSGAAICMTVSPNGRLIAILLLHATGWFHMRQVFSLLLLDSRTLRILTSCRTPFDLGPLRFSPDSTKLAEMGRSALYLFRIHQPHP